ncbi:PQQ-binding-like beta-propeller repeat protein [Halomicroarcula sp. F13]|uniref:PQQ-binding-like beta-propeller repeat protein n=1 Tax=Haloarcula rubra TaxID=2487747 RepID=A0AAW4PTS4_9EURY|nr:PQQ-binding-like beta-propeller repeat protein [Halomicroarcula rubra]MBX0324069.1 PQQ-binding-like beta-propeller repeat protein [Halomicroarcula rubra]
MHERGHTRRAFLAGVGTAVAGSLAGCQSGFDPLASTPLDEFAATQFRQGLLNQGYTDRSIPVNVEKAWELPTNRGDHTAAKGSPVLAPTDDLVVADDTGRVRAISTDGEVQWATTITQAGRGSHGTAAVANETAYVGTYDGAVSALDLETGRRRWRTDLGDAIGASPTYYNGVLYVAVEHAAPSGSVAAVDAATGSVQWRDSRPTNHPHSTVALSRDDGRLLFGSNDGHVYAWSFPDLERAWTHDTGGDVKAPIAVVDGLAVVPSWAGTVTALDVADGAVAWEFEADADLMCAPAVDGGTVYVGSHDDNLYAIDLESGEERWRFDTDGWVIGSAVATPDHVLVGSYTSTLYALGRESGDVTWAVDNRGHVTSAPLVTEDAIYYTERAVDGEADRPGYLYKLVAA